MGFKMKETGFQMSDTTLKAHWIHRVDHIEYPEFTPDEIEVARKSNIDLIAMRESFAAKGWHSWSCSNCENVPWWCGVTEEILPPFCPWCGADVEGIEEADE